ncbi:hypothetical protein BGX33_008375 [Mortierella sp. NVP41]|nr:hypothetical protein BGX33_008375 [Mortierella sp. NVP41]
MTSISTYPFYQVDVFTDKSYLGNPVAVIVALDPALPVPSDEQMQKIANWTNLSETTFLLPPTDPTKADYKVRIYTPTEELPFAGHPTIGTCRTFLEHAKGGVQQSKGKRVVQECGVGLVTLSVAEDGSIAFTAPPLSKTGPVDEETIQVAVKAMGIAREDVVDTQWVVNGPNWVALRVKDVATVLKCSRIPSQESKKLKWGVVGLYPAEQRQSADAPFCEVRAFPHAVEVDEDPVTGSFNAGVAQWMIGTGLAPANYIASQGQTLGRAGRVVVRRDDSDLTLEATKRPVWIGGESVICIRGTIQI